MGLVMHASQCQVEKCSHLKCRRMKILVSHVREELHTENCPICGPMIRLLTRHAKICQVTSEIKAFLFFVPFVSHF